MAKRIVVVAGEPSGDRLGAMLAIELQKRDPEIEIEGVFGAEMIAVGCVQLASMDTLAVMGFIDPIKSLPAILRLRSWLIRYILDEPPDLFIGIDAPDFNLGVELLLRSKGIRTVHYVSPTVWAWREGRVKKIKRAVDMMLTVFPFEEEFYKRHDVPVSYVGHPTADIVPMVPDKQAAKRELGIDVADPVIAVLPGSRNSEMKHMVPLYIKALAQCAAAYPQLRFVVALVQPAYKYFIEHWRTKLAPDLQLQYVLKDSFLVMRAADCALVTSGTATLELLLHKTPMVVAYKTNWLNYQIGKLLIKVQYISLPNILANDRIVPEFIQYDATADALAAELIALLSSAEQQQLQTNKFMSIHKQLQQGATNMAATQVLQLLEG